MKILKIFGLVVGIHVIAFMFVFAIPGCRSTRRQASPAAAETETTTAAPTRPQAGASSPISGSPSDLQQALNPGAPRGNSSYAPASTLGTPPAVRFNPTRPGAASSAPTTAANVPETTSASTHTVVAGDTLWKIAKANAISINELAAANKLRANAPLRPGQKLIVPGKATPMSSTPIPSQQPAGNTLVYKVRSGDSLALIARRAGTTTAVLKQLNKLKGDTIRAGQDLLLPADATTAANLAAISETTPSPQSTSGGSARHVVQSGENLGVIARRYGVTRKDLAVANNIVNPQHLRIGQELVIPGAKALPARDNAPPEEPTVSPQVEPEESAPESGSPILPAPADEGSPIAPASEPVPPVIQVQESNPVASPESGN